MASFYFPQFEHEPFWRFYWRLGDSLPPNHGIEIWEMCQVMYDGLNVETRDLMESMHNGDTYEWEMGMQNNCQVSCPNMSSHTPYPSSDHHLPLIESPCDPLKELIEAVTQLTAMVDHLEKSISHSTVKESFISNEEKKSDNEDLDSCFELCEKVTEVNDSYVPFSIKMDLIPSFPIQNLPSYLKEPAEDISCDLSLQVHPSFNVQIGGCNILPSDVYNPPYFDLSLEFSFDSPLPLNAKFYFSFPFWKFGVVHDHMYILLSFLTFTSCYMLLFCEFHGSMFDELLRSLTNYLLARSSY